MKKEKVVTATETETAVTENKAAVKAENKKAKQKDKKPGFFKRIGMRLKDTFAELKKVSWPTFPKVVKNTCVVLIVVLAFLIVITAFDFGLLNLLKLVSPQVGA